MAFFPGGNVELQDSRYAVTARRILKLAMQAHSKGKYFPIWGTCLGHEFLAAYVANATGDVLSNTDSINITLTMKFAKGYEKSRLFRSIPPFLKSYLSKVPATANFHHFSVTSETYKNNKKLTDFFQVLSTSVDRKGVEFISTMEAKNYPIFSTQWHPERNAFEWYWKYRDNHEQGGILVTQYMANFFVSQTRLNHNKFESREKEEAALIYNYVPKYTGNISGFEQCYFFD